MILGIFLVNLIIDNCLQQTICIIIFKLTDKHGSFVIMNKTDYISKVNNQLYNIKYYKKIPLDPTLQIANDLSIFFRFLYSKHRITKTLLIF